MTAVPPAPQEAALPPLVDVSPAEVQTLLTARGWHEHQRFDERGGRWVHANGGGPHYVLVPYDRALDDYEERLIDLVGTLAIIEGRAPEMIAEELTHSGADLMHIAVPTDSLDNSLALEAGTRLYQAARDTVTAAALAAAASAPQPVFGRGRRPQQALEFIERIRLMQPSRGSFVVTLAAPVERGLAVAAEAVAATEPFSRRALRTLAEALALAVQRASESPEMVAASDAVERGVNANLLGAVASILGDDTDAMARFEFAWTPAVALRGDVPREVVVPASARPVFLDAAVLLRSRAPIYDATVEGPVVTLTKSGPRYGVATVEGVVEDAVRFVEVDLDELEYNHAIDAHRNDLYVRVTGDIDRTGQRWRIRDAASFEVLGRGAQPAPPELPAA
jgi:hypothetical protein